MSGKPVTSKPVYGYLMDEDENYIVDEETAPVVKQIYQLCLAGNGPTKIARMLYGAANPHAGDAGISAGRAAPAAITPAMCANGRRTPSSTCPGKPGVHRLSGKLQDGEALLQDQAQRREPRGEAGHFPRTTMSRLSTRKHGSACRSYASSANARTAMMKWGCSPVCCSAPTAAM